VRKPEIDAAEIRQIAQEIAWRHFWLTHVMTETVSAGQGKT
jgi:hypothetical protein